MENTLENENEFLNSFSPSLEDLQKVSECHDKVLSLIHGSNLHEDLIEYLLNPFEKILQHNGVNLQETEY